MKNPAGVAQQLADSRVKCLAITRTGVRVVSTENVSVDWELPGVSLAQKKGGWVGEYLVSDLLEGD